MTKDIDNHPKYGKITSMTRLKRFISRLGSFILILGPALNLFYFAWEGLQNFIPLPVFLEGRVGIGVVAIIGNLLHLPAFWVTDLRLRYRIPLTIISIPMFCLMLFIGIHTEKLLDSAQMGENRYHLTAIHEMGDPIFSGGFYKCDLFDLICEDLNILSTTYVTTAYESDLMADLEREEVHIFVERPIIGYDLIFTYGFDSRRYGDGEDYGEYSYSLENQDYVKESSQVTYVIFRCDIAHTSCQYLPFRYVSNFTPYAQLEIESLSGELIFSIEHERVFILGDQSRCIADGCTLTIK